MAEPLPDLGARRSQIPLEIAPLDDFGRGSVDATCHPCSKRGCASGDRAGHGPQVRLSFERYGRTDQQSLSDPAQIHKASAATMPSDQLRLHFNGAACGSVAGGPRGCHGLSGVWPRTAPGMGSELVWIQLGDQARVAARAEKRRERATAGSAGEALRRAPLAAAPARCDSCTEEHRSIPSANPSRGSCFRGVEMRAAGLRNVAAISEQGPPGRPQSRGQWLSANSM